MSTTENEAVYFVIAYQENWATFCRGCKMDSGDSVFEVHQCASMKEVQEKLDELHAREHAFDVMVLRGVDILEFGSPIYTGQAIEELKEKETSQCNATK